MRDIIGECIAGLLIAIIQIIMGAIVIAIIIAFIAFMIWAWTNWKIGLAVIGALVVCWIVGSCIFD